ncbi:hypothetical protein E5F05_04620 (plasmid) [Deinococcus metallilatus]|uniref:Uncharacterized protein n=1 Tax=Deinococcus metallilatus TaxID=1211322 RepID=A0AAJ5JZJ6_9DEIO|nr:hypothetical protein [Deinococcus metallilatus]MBB5293770.1 hypothetical protein [Deinococcus metallilatus]QBY07271.1 hypothetical protein E5F05_04620 [Deinococcus metallilatus]RXJ14743.1 hypothetical protein ERJ73_03350 [Deinococcus metallilatus]TLK30863.1 hypothetical protein FCS05_03665 [Deinococcus metallilatus]GMA17699.1 hypothetical protein GCM10025871_40300 [Deinococcus metallilatus]
MKTLVTLGVALFLGHAAATSYRIGIFVNPNVTSSGSLGPTGDASSATLSAFGHMWIAFIVDDRVDSTYGFWGEGPFGFGGGGFRDDREVADTQAFLRGNVNGMIARFAHVNDTRFNWAKANIKSFSGCTSYKPVGGTGGQCNCIDFATRTWHVLTANWEDFRVGPTTNLSVSTRQVARMIQDKNGGYIQGDLDGGKVWR